MNTFTTLHVSHTIPKPKLCVVRTEPNIFAPANHTTENGEMNGGTSRLEELSQ